MISIGMPFSVTIPEPVSLTSITPIPNYATFAAALLQLSEKNVKKIPLS
jgi:hypothetical protein